MHPGRFNQLHDARNEDVVSIADRIDFDFTAMDVLIDQHRLILVNFNRRRQIFDQFFILMHDLHRPAT